MMWLCESVKSMRRVLPPIGAETPTVQPAAAQERVAVMAGSPLVGVSVSVAPVMAEFGVATVIAACNIGPLALEEGAARLPGPQPPSAKTSVKHSESARFMKPPFAKAATNSG